MSGCVNNDFDIASNVSDIPSHNENSCVFLMLPNQIDFKIPLQKWLELGSGKGTLYQYQNVNLVLTVQGLYHDQLCFSSVPFIFSI